MSHFSSTLRRVIDLITGRTDTASLSVGDTLQWNGVRFAPDTPSGGVDETALHPGEPLTEIVGDDGGVGYESPDNVPVFAFRDDLSANDRLQIWAGGYIRFGDGSGIVVDSIFPTSDGIEVQTQGTRLLDINGVVKATGDDKVGFFGVSPILRPGAIADATDPTSTQARLNDLLAAMRVLGLIAS